MAEIKIKKAKVIVREKVSKSGNAYKQYSIMESHKDKKNDKWVNVFWDAYFPNPEGITDKTVIENIEAFTMASEYNERVTTTLYVKDYTITQVGEPVRAEDDGNDLPISMGFVNVPDGLAEELPFAAPTRG